METRNAKKDAALARIIRQASAIGSVVEQAESNLRQMKEYWGEECPDYDPECPACKAWFEYKMFGVITK